MEEIYDVMEETGLKEGQWTHKEQ